MTAETESICIGFGSWWSVIWPTSDERYINNAVVRFFPSHATWKPSSEITILVLDQWGQRFKRPSGNMIFHVTQIQKDELQPLMFQPAQGEVEESQEPPSKKQKLTEVPIGNWHCWLHLPAQKQSPGKAENGTDGKAEDGNEGAEVEHGATLSQNGTEHQRTSWVVYVPAKDLAWANADVRHMRTAWMVVIQHWPPCKRRRTCLIVKSVHLMMSKALSPFFMLIRQGRCTCNLHEFVNTPSLYIPNANTGWHTVKNQSYGLKKNNNHGISCGHEKIRKSI